MLTKQEISDLLLAITVKLEMPQHLYEAAVAKYEEIGEWLAAKDENAGRREPEIYAQGSFRLGTINRPPTDEDDYDVDLVYLRGIQKASTTQPKLKEEAGDHLRHYVKHKRESGGVVPELEPGRRCWTLKYPADFHMDVLPAIPDEAGKATAILITDKKLAEWQCSDPIGYANWFWDRMREEADEQLKKIAMEAMASVEDIPRWKVKTTLQRAVQLIKRHRDIRFLNDFTDKPPSILVTTLAAKAYQRQNNLYDALLVITQNMDRFLELRSDGWWVENPVNAKENFADKWKEYPERADKCRRWLQQIKQDFAQLAILASRELLNESVGARLGFGIVKQAADSLGLTKNAAALAVAALNENVPALADISHAQQPHWAVREIGRVKVTGDVFWKKYGTKKLYKFSSSSPINKDFAIKFTATTNIGDPYKVWWQVVNTGQEAFAAGQPRGTFFEGSGPSGTVNWESTKYRGTHWVEAFVVKDGVCVARSGRVFVKVR